MITINVVLKVKSECRTDYLNLMEELVSQSRGEKGCLIYTHCENVSQHNEFLIIENWESQEHVEKHNQTAHFEKFIDLIDVYLEDELKIQVS